MLMHAITYLRALAAQWHPGRRRALAKRRLEAVCRNHGASRAQAAGIAGEFYRDD